MLIPSPRHTPADLALWAELEACDRAAAAHRSLSKKAARAVEAIGRFLAAGPAYLGVSWGKDSVCAADLALRAARVHAVRPPPLVWVRVEPIANPDCAAVRDAFLAARPGVEYHEVATRCVRDAAGWHATGTLEEGFREAVRRFGRRRLSGVRADESGERTRSARASGVVAGASCRPLLWWSAPDVFAWLARHDLPAHPAYAMLGGGRYERDRVRVASLGGRRGDGMGRAEWEREYYGDALRRLEAGR